MPVERRDRGNARGLAIGSPRGYNVRAGVTSRRGALRPGPAAQPRMGVLQPQAERGDTDLRYHGCASRPPVAGIRPPSRAAVTTPSLAQIVFIALTFVVAGIV